MQFGKRPTTDVSISTCSGAFRVGASSLGSLHLSRGSVLRDGASHFLEPNRCTSSIERTTWYEADSRQPTNKRAVVHVPSEHSSGCGSVFNLRAVSSCPFTECNLGETLRVPLSQFDMSDDYQRQRLLCILVAVHP